jgi:hypothetical protein
VRIKDRGKERLGARGGGDVKNDKLRDLACNDAFADAPLHFCNARFSAASSPATAADPAPPASR